MYASWIYPEQSHGKLLFSNSNTSGAELSKIIISNSQQHITLENKSDYWVVAEADDYYADVELVNLLLIELSRSTLYSSQEATPANLDKYELKKPILNIKTYANQTLLDDIDFGALAGKEQYRYAKSQNKEEIWLTDGTYNLPTDIYTWVIQPVMDLPSSMVAAIEIGDQKLHRPTPMDNFINADEQNVDIIPQLNLTSTIKAINIKSASSFETLKHNFLKQITITTFQGLIIKYNIYNVADAYWLNIELSATHLPKQEVNAYIKENGMFYNNWYFQIPAIVGQTLVSLPFE